MVALAAGGPVQTEDGPRDRSDVGDSNRPLVLEKAGPGLGERPAGRGRLST
jgi:hypothetical protein